MGEGEGGRGRGRVRERAGEGEGGGGRGRARERAGEGEVGRGRGRARERAGEDEGEVGRGEGGGEVREREVARPARGRWRVPQREESAILVSGSRKGKQGAGEGPREQAGERGRDGHVIGQT